MDNWRIAATILTTVVGAMLVLGTMGKVRDNRHRYGGSVTRTGLQGLSILVVVDLLVATVLPATVCWALIAGGALLTSILMVIG